MNNKSRKTSHITNIIQFDADGHVVIPASLTLGIAPGADDNSSKVPSTAWVRGIITTAGGGYVPTGRTITINGVSYDLSANRAWSIDTGVMTATAGAGISVSTVSQNLNIVNTGLLSGSAGAGISVSTVNQNLNIVNTGLLSATSGAGISVSTVNQNLNIVNTGLLSATAGSGITVSTVDQNLNIVNTGLLTATAGLGITVSTVGQNLNIVNTGILTASAGAGISVSVVGQNLNIVNTITDNNQLANGAGYATTSYVTTQINNLVAGAPGLLDTLDELAAALGDDPNFATTISTALGNRLRIDIGTQGLTSTQQGYGRTNLGLGSLATLSSIGDSYITDLAWSKLTGVPSTFTPSAHTHDDRYYTETEIANFFSGASVITGYNKSNWDTAYGWGNHASAGYLTTSSAASTYVALGGSYANPAWLTSLGWSKITGAPAFLISYTETDTLASVTARGASTSTPVTIAGVTITSTSGGIAYLRPSASNGSILVGDDSGLTTRGLLVQNNGGAIISTAASGQVILDTQISGTSVFRVNGNQTVTILGNTVWHAGNDGSGSGLDADTVDGYHATNAANGLAYYASNGYLYVPSWINVNGGGIFAGTNNAHLRPNTGSYGSWEIIGSRNGWSGIYFNDTATTLMMNSNESGHYRDGYGWQFRWYNGTFYISTSGQGGGSEYIALHSGNYTTWAQPKVYQGQSAGDWQNFTNDVGEFRVDEVLNITSGAHSNYPPNVYTYGGVLSWRLNNHSFQLYASHTGDLTFKTQWGNDNYSGWRRILHESNYNSWAPSLTGSGASGTWGISITGVASQVSINYNNDSNSTYQLLWGSGNSVYGTSNIYVNPSSDTIYATAYRGNANVAGTGEATYHPAGIYSTGTNWLYGTMYLNVNSINDTADIRTYNSSYHFRARYTPGSDIYHASLNWYGLQLGNNGDNYIIGGRTNPGGNLRFYVNNTSDFTSVNGTLSAMMHSSGRTSFGTATDAGYMVHVAGDIYANGGWVRVSGGAGLYFESYGGGWRMNGSSYIESYNGKSLHMQGGSVDYVGSLYLEGGGQGVHLQPNTGGSYGSLQITGSRNGWSGLRFTASNVNIMANTNEVGFYNNGVGWQLLWSGGTGYIYKGGTGAGTQATILDSSNAPYAWNMNQNVRTTDSPTFNSLRLNGNLYMDISAGGNSTTIFLTGDVASHYIKANGYWIDFVGNANEMMRWYNSSYSYYSMTLNGSNNLFVRGDIYVNGNGNSTGSAVIHSGNIGSQSVSYASSAGNADTVDGYHASNFLGKNGNSYYQQDTWIQSTGTHGLYAPSSGSGTHWYPGTAYSYGSWIMEGFRNNYIGIQLYGTTGPVVWMHDSSGNGGLYDHTDWYFYFHRSNRCMGVNGSTTSSSYAIYANSKGIYSAGDVVAYSDARKKTDIITIDNALSKVKELRGVYYTRIDQEEKGRQTGVIAQEINEVLPEVVTYAADVDEYGVSYGNIVGVLIEAIKEQQKQIEDLKSELNGLTK